MICDHYDSVGCASVSALYFDEEETTYTNAMGAQQNATCLVEGIKAMKDCSLADYLKIVKPQ